MYMQYVWYQLIMSMTDDRRLCLHQQRDRKTAYRYIYIYKKSVNPINPKLLRFHKNRRWALDQQRNTPFSTPRDSFSMRDVGAQSGSNSLVTHWMDATLHLTRDKHETMAQQFTISVASQRLYLYQPPNPSTRLRVGYGAQHEWMIRNDTKNQKHIRKCERERERWASERPSDIIRSANRKSPPCSERFCQYTRKHKSPDTQHTTDNTLAHHIHSPHSVATMLEEDDDILRRRAEGKSIYSWCGSSRSLCAYCTK